MAVHLWRALTWSSFRALDHPIVILPLGALEAHGPHLPLGTDLVIAEAMARAGAERLSRRGLDIAVLPALPLSPAPFASGFAGTIDAPAAATTALVSAVAENVKRHGGRATVIANAHHDPAHVEAIRRAVAEVEQNGSGPLVFPDLTRKRWAAMLTEEFQSGACHAGRYEGSVVLAESPDLVDTGRMSSLAPNPRSLVDAIRRGDKTFAEAGGPEAYFGSPADASAAEGREIVERLGEILETAVLEELGERRTKNEEGRTERRTENEERNERNEEQTEERERGTTEDGRTLLNGPQGVGAVASLEVINPPGLGRPSGFSHGVLAPAGWRPLAVAGQTGVSDGPERDLAAQFDRALLKVLTVVREAGAKPSHVGRMTIYVTDMQAYRNARPSLGEVWKRHMGRHYPAMTLVEVSGLVDHGALVEIQADAVVPSGTERAPNRGDR